MTTTGPVEMASRSLATDGGFVAIADVAAALAETGAGSSYRLIGGVAVMLHVQRLGLDLTLRATADADIGVPLHALQSPRLVDGIEARGYRKTAGNRWERQVDDRRVAAVDLLIPAYRTRARQNVRVGDHVTTEVPGLAVALKRRPVVVDAHFLLTDGRQLTATAVLPDAIGCLALKAGARTVRHDSRDVEDLWRCLEIAAAEGVRSEDFSGDSALADVARLLVREFGAGGTALPELTADLQPAAAARLRTRLRALVAEVVSNPG